MENTTTTCKPYMKLLAGITLKDGQALYNNAAEASPSQLAVRLFMEGANELLIHDTSVTDEEHDKNLDIIKEICEKTAIKATVYGHMFRAEDIKKQLYAGAFSSGVDWSADDKALLKEGALRFGKNRMTAIIYSLQELEADLQYLSENAGTVILAGKAEKAELEYMIRLLEQRNIRLIISIREDMENILSQNLPIDGLYTDTDIRLAALAAGNRGISLRPVGHISWEQLKKNSDGLIPVIAQEKETNQVLMLAYMNEEAYNKTLTTGLMTYYSRSRNELWTKGLTSGHFQYLCNLKADCDRDTLLAEVVQIGAACHTGEKSCFFDTITEYDSDGSRDNPLTVFQDVYNVIMDRKLHPKEGSYTNYLFDKGIDKILKKLGEEATEIVIAAKNPNSNEVKYEISDFLYHCMVLMACLDISWQEITEDLAKR